MSPGFACVKDPDDDDEGKGVQKSLEDAVAELGAAERVSAVPPEREFLALLECGHTVLGSTRATHIRFGVHGALCEACGGRDSFRTFKDIVFRS